MAIETRLSVRISAEGAAATKRDVRGVGESVVEMSSSVDIARQSWTEFNQALETGKKALAAAKTVVDTFVSQPLGLAVAFERDFAAIKTLGAKLPDDLEQQLLDLARRVPQTAGDITKAAYNAISSGVDPTNVTRFLEAASKAAVGGQSTLTEATTALVTATNAYKASGLDATRAADVLFATVQKGIVTFDQLAAAQGSSLGPAAALGASFEEMNAAVATISQVIPSAAESFTRVDALIKGLTKPTDEAEKAFKRFGIGFGVTNLQAKGLAGVLAEIREKTGGSAEALSQLAGRNKELLEGLVLINNDYKGFRDNLTYIGKAAGQTESAFKTLGNTTGGTFDALKSEFEGLLLQVGKELLPTAKAMLQDLKAFLSGPGGQAMIEGLKNIAVALMEIAKYAVTAGTKLINNFFGGEAFAAMRKYREAMAQVQESTKGAAVATVDLGTALREAYDAQELAQSQENLFRLAEAASALQTAQANLINANLRAMRAETGAELANALKQQVDALKQIKDVADAGRAAIEAVKPAAAPVAAARAAALPVLPPEIKAPRGQDNRGDLAAEALYNDFMEQQRALDQIARDAAAARAALMADETARIIAEVRERYGAQIALAREYGAETALLERVRDKKIAEAVKAQADHQFQAQQVIQERSAALIADQTTRELALLAIRYEAEQRQYADNKTILGIIDAEYIAKKLALEEDGYRRAQQAAAEEMARQARDTSTMAGNVDNALGALKELIGVSQVFEKLQMIARGAKYAADAAGYTADAIAAGAAGNPIAAIGFGAAAVAAAAAAAKYGASAAGLMGGRGGGGARAAGGSARAPTLSRSDMPRPAKDSRPVEMNVNLFAGDGRPLTRWEAREVMQGISDLQRIAGVEFAA